MKNTIVATLLGLAATSLAASFVERAANTSSSSIQLTLCNDFHGGKPCETNTVKPGVCSKCSPSCSKETHAQKNRLI